MKVKFEKIPSSEITKSAIKELTLRGCEVWRNNNVRAVPGRIFTGRKGVSDIIGYEKKGSSRAVYCEVKANGDKLSADQIDFLTKAKRAGCITLIAQQNKNIVELVEF